MQTPSTSISRRSFLHTGAAAVSVPMLGAGFSGASPNATLNVACVGVGGMGRGDLKQVAGGKHVHIAALCDVDARALGAAAKLHPKARQFRDYRKLLDEMGKDIDAVVVSTPDHMHGSIAIAALQLGKHVYCQKPIAHNLYECRMMATLATKNNLVTQMGTQIHSHAAYRTAVASVRAGVIGKVREAHAWVSRSWAGPKEGRPKKTDPVPAYLDWDLWLGVAPRRPFVDKIYHPGRWRGWLDFGSGTLGDMGCHIFDPVFSALGIGAPEGVTAHGVAHHRETFAPDGDIRYVFPGTDWTTDKLPLRWTDGRNKSRPDASRAQLPKGAKLPGAGSFLVGEKGVLVIPHWSKPKAYKDGAELDVKLTELPSVNHYHEWTDACRGVGTASTPFSYSGPLTEAVLLGTIAGRFPGTKLAFDIDSMRFGDEKADALVKRTYRKGWEL